MRVLGADGGGTRLRLALADGDGGILARREGPPAHVGPGGGAKAARVLWDAAQALLGESGEELPVAAACLGLAGAGRRSVAEGLERRLEDLGLARRVRVVSDARVALEDAFPGEAGILLVAGTGSIALARTSDGAFHRVGGWGPLVGDEGSGTALGLAGLRVTLQAIEGRGADTRLASTLRDATGTQGPSELFAWAQEATRDRIAALAPRVVEAGAAGDPVARRLTERAIRDLVAHVVALRARTASLPVALSGGLLDEGGPLREGVLAALQDAGMSVRTEAVDGARGGVRLALLPDVPEKRSGRTPSADFPG